MSGMKINADTNLVVNNLIGQIADLSRQSAISTAIVEQQAQEIEQLKARIEGSETE